MVIPLLNRPWKEGLITLLIVFKQMEVTNLKLNFKLMFWSILQDTELPIPTGKTNNLTLKALTDLLEKSVWAGQITNQTKFLHYRKRSKVICYTTIRNVLTSHWECGRR